MPTRKLKYQIKLDKFPNCPPDNYSELSENAFRWVFQNDLNNSFIPLNVTKEPPPRMLDDADLMCKGYGLSFFTTFDKALYRFQELYNRKRAVSHIDFIAEKGDSIAELQMTTEEGIFGDLNNKNGHFTFHEFETTDLSQQVLKIKEIFDNNGKYKRQGS